MNNQITGPESVSHPAARFPNGNVLFAQYMQMAQHLGVSQGYKQDGVSQVQQRGVSMIMSSDSGGVPYSHVVPQLATLQIGSSVSPCRCFGTILMYNHDHLLRRN